MRRRGEEEAWRLLLRLGIWGGALVAFVMSTRGAKLYPYNFAENIGGLSVQKAVLVEGSPVCNGRDNIRKGSAFRFSSCQFCPNTTSLLGTLLR